VINRTDINVKDVEDLKEGIVDPVPNHEYTEMGTMKKHKNVFATLQWLAGTFTIIGTLTLLTDHPENFNDFLFMIHIASSGID
jgi:hypothetical protein